jgi:predicted nucleotidyltransferase
MNPRLVMTREEAIDILVTLDDYVEFFMFLDLQFRLEELLGHKIDLVTPKALKPLTRPSIERDLVYVA